VQPTTIPEGNQLPTMVKILDVRQESSDTHTLWLDHEMEFQAGQFVMIWIPRLDEKPYTLSAVTPDYVAITVRQRGKFSNALTRLKAGDQVGIRGPYGRGFSPEEPLVIVAGGCGVAPVALLKDRFPDAPFICGARTAGELMFQSRFPDMLVCTDDGSAGHHGFPTDLLKEQLESGEVKTVCTCGPEPMMKAVVELCMSMNVPVQAGLERYMKCGYGICAQCTCGDQLVCQDGPVFTGEELATMSEFGKSARLKSGRNVSLSEYANWCSG
jgi:dihydroorotate dehydrogenase electron transfer subunit